MSPDADLWRYEPLPSLIAGGENADLGLEARRLRLLVQAGAERRAISARRAEGWRPVDEAFAAADDRPDLAPCRVDWRCYLRSAPALRAEAEAYRARRAKRKG
jgi:hypothetical protein